MRTRRRKILKGTKFPSSDSAKGTKFPVTKRIAMKGGATFEQIGVTCIYRGILMYPPLDNSDIRYELSQWVSPLSPSIYNNIIHSGDIENASEYRNLMNTYDNKINIDNYDEIVAYFNKHPKKLQPITIGKAAVLRDALTNNRELSDIFDENHPINVKHKMHESTYLILTKYMVHGYDGDIYGRFLEDNKTAKKYINDIEKVIGIERYRQVFDAAPNLFPAPDRVPGEAPKLFNWRGLTSFNTHTHDAIYNATVNKDPQSLGYGNNMSILSVHNNFMNADRHIAADNLEINDTSSSSSSSSSSNTEGTAASSAKPKRNKSRRAAKSVAASREPLVPLSESREPLVPLAASREPLVPLSESREPLVPLSESREPLVPLAASREPLVPLEEKFLKIPPGYIRLFDNLVGTELECNVELLEKKQGKIKKSDISSMTNIDIDLLPRDVNGNKKFTIDTESYGNIRIFEEVYSFSRDVLSAKIMFKLPDKPDFDITEYFKYLELVSKTKTATSIVNVLIYVSTTNLNKCEKSQIDYILQYCEACLKNKNITNNERVKELAIIATLTLEYLKKYGDSSKYFLSKNDIQSLINLGLFQFRVGREMQLNNNKSLFIRMLKTPENVKVIVKADLIKDSSTGATSALMPQTNADALPPPQKAALPPQTNAAALPPPPPSQKAALPDTNAAALPDTNAAFPDSQNTIIISYRFKVDISDKINSKTKISIEPTKLKITPTRTNSRNNNNTFDSPPFYGITVLTEDFTYNKDGYIYANVMYKLPEKKPFIPSEYMQLSIKAKNSSQSQLMSVRIEHVEDITNLFEYIASSNLRDYYSNPNNMKMIELMLNKCKTEDLVMPNTADRCVKTLEELADENTRNFERHYISEEDVNYIISHSFNQIKKNRQIIVTINNNTYYFKVTDIPEQIRLEQI